MVKCALRIGLATLLVVVQSGCGPLYLTTGSDAPYVRVRDRPAFGTIGVVAAQFAPEADIDLGRSQGTGSGAATGAAVGTGIWLMVALASLSSCILAPPGCGPALAPFLLGGTAAGAVIGASAAARAPATVTPEQARAAVSTALGRLDMQRALQSDITSYANLMSIAVVKSSYPGPSVVEDRKSYVALKNNTIGNVLEIGIIHVGMHPVGRNSSVLTMTARARLIQTSDDAAIHEAMYRFVSRPFTLAEWSENDAALFRQVLYRGYQELAEQTVDRLLLVYEPPGPREWGGRFGHCVRGPIIPEYPKGISPFCARCAQEYFHIDEQIDSTTRFSSAFFPKVDSLQPILRWGKFPAASDIEADDTKQMDALKDVIYDVRLYDAASRFLIYDGTSLAPEHKVLTPLSACKRYFWAVRARFSMSGQVRTTEWSGTYNTGYTQCYLSTGPAAPRSYYGFSTPCARVSK